MASGSSGEDAAWRELVARYAMPAAAEGRPAPWPAREDLGQADDPGPATDPGTGDLNALNLDEIDLLDLGRLDLGDMGPGEPGLRPGPGSRPPDGNRQGTGRPGTAGQETASPGNASPGNAGPGAAGPGAAGPGAAGGGSARQGNGGATAGPDGAGWPHNIPGARVIRPARSTRPARSIRPARPVPRRAHAGDDEHYVPPPPPPLPHLDPVAKGAWVALFGGPGYLLVAVLLGWTVPGWAAFCGIAAFVGGFATLVIRMGDQPPRDSGPDDGAVV